MKKCKACQKEIDKKATVCPYCRTKQVSKPVQVISVIITIVVVIWILGAIFGGGSKSSTSSSTGSKSQSANAKTDEKPMEVEAATLVSEFDKNKLAAQEKYTGKKLQLTAYIGNISQDVVGQYFLSLNPNSEQYYYGTSIQCFFADKSALTKLEKGQAVTITGKADDMSLGIIVLKECSLVN